ncbi:Inner membrane protein yjgN [Citrobacter amalonaticus]|nr:Inner membrane protein yjgN [Citrobacter amalonaticus]
MQEYLIKEEAPSHAFEFRGDGGSYFLICLVNSLLVLVTLGIYPAVGINEMPSLYLFQYDLKWTAV